MRISVFASVLPTVETTCCYGMFGPAKLPANTTDQLNAEFTRALKVSRVIEQLDNLRLSPVGDTPKAFTAFMESEYKRFAEMVKISGYQPE